MISNNPNYLNETSKLKKPLKVNFSREIQLVDTTSFYKERPVPVETSLLYNNQANSRLNSNNSTSNYSNQFNNSSRYQENDSKQISNSLLTNSNKYPTPIELTNHLTRNSKNLLQLTEEINAYKVNNQNKSIDLEDNLIKKSKLSQEDLNYNKPTLEALKSINTNINPNNSKFLKQEDSNTDNKANQKPTRLNSFTNQRNDNNFDQSLSNSLNNNSFKFKETYIFQSNQVPYLENLENTWRRNSKSSYKYLPKQNSSNLFKQFEKENNQFAYYREKDASNINKNLSFENQYSNKKMDFKTPSAKVENAVEDLFFDNQNNGHTNNDQNNIDHNDIDHNNNENHHNDIYQQVNGNDSNYYQSNHPQSPNSMQANLQQSRKTSQQYVPNKSQNQTAANGTSSGSNNSNGKPRRPINASVEENIYSITSNPSSTASRSNPKGHQQVPPLNRKAVASNQPPIQRQAVPRNRQQHQQNSQDFTDRQVSPTRSTDIGPKIVKRELWWKEPPPSQVSLPLGGKVKVDNVSHKIDHKNTNYNPNRQNSKIIESRKLEWNKQAAVDTWGNFSHQPKGGNKKYPQENVSWSALPKIDSGFIYTFDENA